MRVFWQLLILFAVIGCAPEAPQITKAQISLGALVSVESYPAGLFFYAKHRDSGDHLSKRLSSNSENIELPNGSWDFSVIGWEGDGAANTPFTGVVKCDHLSGISLSGDDTSISFTLASANCNSTLFTGGITSGATEGLLPLHFYSCTGLRDHLAQNKPIPSDIDCTAGHSLGKSKSFKVALYEFSLTSDPARFRGNALWSKCYDATTAFDKDSMDLRLPTGNLDGNVTNILSSYAGAGKYPVSISTYEDTACSVGEQSHLFKNGLAGKEFSVGAFARVIGVSTSARTAVYLNDDMCSGNWGSSPIINNGAALRSVDGGTNYICNPSQLMDIGSAGKLAGDYTLARNITFTSAQTAGIGTVATPFIGRLDGHNFTISNLILNSSATSLGVFGGVGVGAEISNLNFSNLIVNSTATASADVGGLIGVAEDLMKVSNISINGLTITSTPTTPSSLNVGGLIGSLNLNTYSSFHNIKIQNANISAINTSIALDNGSFTPAVATGGLIGSISRTTSGGGLKLSDSLFVGDIYAGPNTGGLVGLASTADDPTGAHFLFIENSEVGNKADNIRTNIYYSPDRNIAPLTTTDANVGGIVGSVQNTSILKSQSYVLLQFRSPDLAPGGKNFGGIAGKITTGKIKDVLADTITNSSDPSIGILNSVGGAVGEAGDADCNDAGVSFRTTINSASVNFVSNISGFNFGGLVGNYACPPQGLDPNNLLDFAGAGSVIEATIGLENGEEHTDNYNRGGVFGSFGQGPFIGKAKMIIAKSNITGKSAMGGFAGKVYDESEITENAVFSTITTYHTAADTDTGGIVGQHLVSTSNIGIYTNNFVKANIYHSSTPAVGVRTGEFIGAVINAGLTADSLDTITENKVITIIYDNISAVMDTELTGLGSALTIAPNSIDVSEVATAFPGELWVDSSFNAGASLPLFLHKALTYGSQNLIEPLFPRYHGTFFSSYHLSTCDQFNEIQDDFYLLSRSFKLINNIDFNYCSGEFRAIGYSSSGNGYDPAPSSVIPFTGSLLGNNFALRNVNITLAANGGYVGIVRSLMGSQVGTKEFPLRVQGLNIDSDGFEMINAGSIAGHINDGNIYAHVSNGIIGSATTSSSCTAALCLNIGGIAGLVESGTIENSSYIGSLSLNGTFENIGGLIGQINSYTNIYDSFARLTQISTALDGASIGGLLGYGNIPTDRINIERAYVWLDYGNQTIGDVVIGAGTNLTRFGALIGNLNGSLNMYATYSDITGANPAPSSLIGFGTPGTGSDGKGNILINGINSAALNLMLPDPEVFMVQTSEDQSAASLILENDGYLLTPANSLIIDYSVEF